MEWVTVASRVLIYVMLLDLCRLYGIVTSTVCEQSLGVLPFAGHTSRA